MCSILLGKLRSVHIGNDCSGGSTEDEYDSVMPGKTTCVFPFVPSVPLSRRGFLKNTQRRSTYVLASTLSRALVTPSRLFQKSSLKISSVSGLTRSFKQTVCPFRSGFMSWTASAAQSLFILPTSLGRNRNCRFRLLFSIESISVIVIWPLGPVPRPIMAQFFSISQPIAPAPTRNCLIFEIFSWYSLPKTAIWPS